MICNSQGTEVLQHGWLHWLPYQQPHMPIEQQPWKSFALNTVITSMVTLHQQHNCGINIEIIQKAQYSQER